MFGKTLLWSKNMTKKKSKSLRICFSFYSKLPIHWCYIRWHQYMPISFSVTGMPVVLWFSAAVHGASPKYWPVFPIEKHWICPMFNFQCKVKYGNTPKMFWRFRTYCTLERPFHQKWNWPLLGLLPQRNNDKKLNWFSNMNWWRHLYRSIMYFSKLSKLRYSFLFRVNRASTSWVLAK